MHYIMGIDEAGRGAWAGPVSAGGWMADILDADKILQTLTGLTDSKKLSPRKREELFDQIEALQKHGKCHIAYVESSADIIDTVGIREANRQAMEKVIRKLLSKTAITDTITIFIDGCDNYRFNLVEKDIGYDFRKKSIEDTRIPSGLEKIQIVYRIGGDLTVPPISAASIIAKVKRDKKMCDFSREYLHYGFEKHKGYGTEIHHEALLYHGITPIHRKSYAPVKALISEKA